MVYDVHANVDRLDHEMPFYIYLIKRHRRRQRMSQSNLAAAAGLDSSYISRIEAGSRPITRTAAARIADALNLDGRDLAQFWEAVLLLPTEPVGPNIARVIDALYAYPDQDIRPDLATALTQLIGALSPAPALDGRGALYPRY